MDNERGFTLIELLIVLAIMGILVGITALSLGDIIDTTEITTMNAERGTVQTAIDVYNTEKVLGDPCCVPTIEARPTAGAVATTDEFGQFLRRDTKYFYEWSDEGAALAVFPEAD